MPYDYGQFNEVAVSGTAAVFNTQLVAPDRRDAVNVMNGMSAARLAIAVGSTPTATKYHYVLMPGESMDIEAKYHQSINLLALDSGSGNAYVTELVWANQNQH